MPKIAIWEKMRAGDGRPDWEWRLRWLLQSLQLLAADAESLIRAYPSMIPAADDLVNDFDTQLESASLLVDESQITQTELEKARAVDAKISEMSDRDDPSLWTDDGLRTRGEWIEVRRLAKEALEAMGYGLEPPPPWQQRMRIIPRP